MIIEWGLNIHKRLMYQQNFTTYAIFSEDECFMKGGEYNLTLMWMLWHSVLHLTLILMGKIEHCLTLLVSTYSVKLHYLCLCAVHICVCLFELCQNSSVNSTIDVHISEGSVGKRWDQQEKKRHFYSFNLWIPNPLSWGVVRLLQSICVCCL